MASNYWKDSIKQLTPREAVRLRFWMYIWSNDSRGYHHLFYEILSNSIDEVINGYADKIYVRLLDKNTLEIEDNWRWIPFWKKKDWTEVLHMIFTTLHAGWKMDNTQEDSWYKFSGWTNWVWTSVTNFLSTNMYIRSIRDWKIAELEFVNGVSKKWTIIKPYKNKKEHWTLVRFSPDPEIFPNVKWFDAETIKKIIQDQIYLQKMTIVFENHITDEVVTFKNTEWLEKYIIDYNNKTENWSDENNTENDDNDKETTIKKLVTPISRIFINENIELKGPKNQYILLDYAFEFINENKPNIKGFTNSISNPDWWKHVLWFKAWIYKGIKKLLEAWTQADKTIAKDLIPDDVYNWLVWLISIKLPDPEFEGQTKGKLTNAYVKSLVENTLIKEVQKKVLEKDLVNIRKSLQRKIDFRKKIEKENEKLEKIDNEKELDKRLRTKLKDATGKDRMKNELYIVEGDSAGGTLKSVRDVLTQAIMPLKGKPINVFNNKTEKIFKNQEINNLIYAISGGYIWKEFDIKKHLRYGKIILAADADDDGYHIVILLLSFILRYYPILIEKGHVYINVTPLFACKYKNDTKYFYTTKAQEAFMKTKEWKKYQVSRFKGLWEFKAEDGYKFIMSPRTRKLQKVVTNDIEFSIEWFSNLMGPESQYKFDLFNEYIHELLEKIDNDTLWLENKTKDIINIWKDNAVIYSLQVNKDRAIPNLEDWLKSVTRRILYAIFNDIKSRSNQNYVKSAKVVWTTMGNYHAHGDASIYDAMIWITRNYWNNYPLIDWQGNFWTADWDNAAANRYTEVRIAQISEKYYMKELYKNAVDFIENFDNTKTEPVILPAIIPFVLLNDNFWIGYGKMTNSMVQHNIREVLQAVIWYLSKKKNQKFDALEYIKWPDVPTWNMVLNTKAEIREIYNNPKWWHFTFRVPINIIKVKRQKVLEILEYPYRNYNFANEYEKILKLIDNKELLGVKGVYERSWMDKTTNKKWFRLYFTIDQKIDTNLIIEDIYKKTIFERKIPYTPLFLDREKNLKYYTLNDIIAEFIEFRKETILRVTQFEIDKINKELPLLYAKTLQALNVDEIIKIIKKGKNRAEIKKKIIEKYKNKKVLGQKLEIDDEMAELIITTQLINIKDLKALEDKIKSKLKERDKLQERIDKPLILKKYMIKEYNDILSEFKNVRRKTKIMLDKDVKAVRANKERLDHHYKELKEAEKYYNNLLIVSNDDFIQKIPLQSIEKLKEKLKDYNDKKEIKFGEINKNNGKLFIFTNKNKWFNINIDKIPDKKPITWNSLIKQFEWEPFSYVLLDNDKPNLDEIYTVIYVDTKNKVGWYNIKKKDLLKNRQWFNLGKNKIVYISKTEWKLKLDSIKYVRINNSQYKTKTMVDLTKLPTKKSLSSGKLL